MQFLIGLLFYTIFYWFGYMFQFYVFSPFAFIWFLIILLVYQGVLFKIHQHPLLGDILMSSVSTLLYYFVYEDTAIVCYLFLMHFVAFESFTYTYLNRRKLDNPLTKY